MMRVIVKVIDPYCDDVELIVADAEYVSLEHDKTTARLFVHFGGRIVTSTREFDYKEIQQIYLDWITNDKTILDSRCFGTFEEYSSVVD